MRWVIVALGLLLSACSAKFEFGRGIPLNIPLGDKVIEEPNGEVVVEPPASPIEQTITAMSQAQTLRILTRQLAR